MLTSALPAGGVAILDTLVIWVALAWLVIGWLMMSASHKVNDDNRYWMGFIDGNDRTSILPPVAGLAAMRLWIIAF